jgi:enoyl-CoA hydratase/carnithine racemase
MDYEYLKVHVEDRVGWLEYHRPPVNAFNWERLREVARALEFLLDEPNVRVVVFASALKNYFITGADIRLMHEMGGKARLG